MGILDKLKDRVDSRSSATFPSVPALPLGPLSVYRYRKQRGLNLGSWFVLERWIASYVFRNAVAPAQSDFDVARGNDARKILEEHWDSWIKEEDWRWIKQRGFNSVRLPIGYYHLCAPCPEVLAGTDFEPVAEVFAGAWRRIESAIQAAGSHGIGVLIDLHAAAGAQNADAHSGLSKGRPALFDKSSNLRSTSVALRFLASKLAPIPHIVGLELLNEPANNSKLQGWYDATLKEIRAIAGPDFPVYVSDAWDTHHYAGWVGERSDFVVLDHHLYRCFTDQDKAMNGDAHAHKLRREFKGTFDGQSHAAKGNLVVAEWSASIDPRGLGNIPDGEKDRHRREFVKAQLELFEQSAGGWWYWTYKKGQGWDAGWSARNGSQADILPAWVGSRSFRGPPGSEMKEQALKEAHDSHVGYWSGHGGSPDASVFSPGFSQGWDDTLLFLSSPDGVSEMGFSQEWAKRRRIEFEAGGRKLGAATWEWEHGFKQGVEACGKACLH